MLCAIFRSSIFLSVLVFPVCRPRTGLEAHPTETLHRCSLRTSANLVFPAIYSKVRRCAIVDAASLPHRRGYWLPHAGRHSPRLGSLVQCLRPASDVFHPPPSIPHPLPSIFARPADPTTAERSIRSDSEPNSKNTFQILIFFPDFARMFGKPAANSSCFSCIDHSPYSPLPRRERGRG